MPYRLIYFCTFLALCSCSLYKSSGRRGFEDAAAGIPNVTTKMICVHAEADTSGWTRSSSGHNWDFYESTSTTDPNPLLAVHRSQNLNCKFALFEGESWPQAQSQVEQELDSSF